MLANVWAAGDESRVDGLTADSVHPTPAGYTVMAKRLAALIARSRRCDARVTCPLRVAASTDFHWSLLAAFAGLLLAVVLYRRGRKRLTRA